MPQPTTLFQRCRQLYIEEENKLENLVAADSFQVSFQEWLDTTISQLDYQYETCEQQLGDLQQTVAVDHGSYWCSKTIIEHCNLHMAEKRLLEYRKRRAARDEDDRVADFGGSGREGFDKDKDSGAEKTKNTDGEEEEPALPDLINLVSCLQQLKTNSFMTPKQRRFVEECEVQLKKVVFEPRELLFIANALQTKLNDDGNASGIIGDLTNFQNTIENLSPDIDQCEQLLEASIVNGEMGLAEDISKRQLEILEHILNLIGDQYPVISNYYTESRSSDRRRRWAIFRMADKDITAVIEGKYRQIEACEEDLMKIRDQMENYNNDDAHQRKRYEADKNQSDLFLQDNKEKQQSVWNRIYDLFGELQKCQTELGTLARQRRKEIDRRLQTEEREAGRRSGHSAFLRSAAEHAKKLQDTIDNAVAARDLAIALNNFVLDGCDNITSKYDKQQSDLSELLRLVQQHHFKRFSDYYIAASRFLYRKENKLEQIKREMEQNDMQRELMIDQLDPKAKDFAEKNRELALKRREVAEEVLHIRHKLEKAERAIEPTLRSLDYAGVEYVHPRTIVERMNLNRWSTILNYREVMNPSITAMERIGKEERNTLERLRSSMKQQRIESSATYYSNAKTTTSTFAKIGYIEKQGIAQKPQSALAKKIQIILDKRLEDAQTSDPNSATSQGSTSKGISGAATVPGVASSTLTHSRKPYHTLFSSTSPDYSNTYSAVQEEGSAKAAPPPKRMEGATFKALYSYKARAPDELNFEPGDLIVCVCRATEEGWFKGICNQRTGMFPINYVTPFYTAEEAAELNNSENNTTKDNNSAFNSSR